MKFTIDTQKKMVSLEADMTFAELESLKRFIGKGWEKWTIAKTTEVITQMWADRWRPYWFGAIDYSHNNTLLRDHQVYLSTQKSGVYALDTPDLSNFSLGETGVLCSALTT